MGVREGKLVLVTFALFVLGVIFVYSSSFPLSVKYHGHGFHYLVRQLLGAVMGMVLFFVFWLGGVRRWGELSPFLLFASFAGVLLSLVPGIGVGGRWVSLGSLTFQPSEFGKIALLFYLARRLSEREPVDFQADILPCLVILAGFGLVFLLQPDFGMFLLYGALTFFMLWVAGARTGHLLSVGAAGLPLAGMLLVLAPYRLGRILAFIDPEAYRHSYGYQVYQALVALGSGGVLGRGLGASRAKFFYLPSAHNDFVFAVVGEEIGLVGGVLVIVLFVALVLLGYRIAASAKQEFGTFVAAGASFLLGFQALLNLGVVVGVFPVTGLTLPFISYGGSSIAVSLGLVGAMLGVEREARE